MAIMIPGRYIPAITTFIPNNAILAGQTSYSQRCGSDAGILLAAVAPVVFFLPGLLLLYVFRLSLGEAEWKSDLRL